ncbi:Uncharacterized protein OS=Planctomyces brasiliensis (strain ATCC 49424 / DSM 5305 / JCM 21570 / NBRC 103401 / IFAM 1448) GN=Plabr_0221 PE=4 SV=1 [Gemmata massiliana]|uniref:Uncharacterized protein n=1 Tax=Gemmata massiliana TaxID=1210884 RepID=A0A6P2CXV8_9BACT|nr:hypothetical protein [Gemmata massiliana]VTR93216.1 Uncharacterized protein OS=Planctomyces brasiliensis (strain ATCC 49424 / DSM 5305 / JCM 21570 / NBRC 103401 / IFAM 1448) GN=Plabr_0221 PE=4 SV=1 [Gemmata massiliana]
MATQRLTERTAAPFAGARVNREAGTIDDVLICGTASANGRDYPVSVFKRDYSKYEGKPVNCDHGRESTVDRRFGWFTRVRPGPDGRPRGRLNCLKSHPMYERVMEAAERNPALFGFSHVAMCDTRRGPNGREVVEAIREVESVDLVAQPATTKGLFEGRSAPFSAQHIAAWGAKLPIPVRRTEVDMDSNIPADDATIPAPADDYDDTDDTTDTETDDTNDVISASFKAAITAVIDKAMAGELDARAALSKIRTLLNSHADATNDDGTPDTDGDPTTPESRQKTGAAIWGVIEACEKSGFAGYTRTDLDLIAAVPAERRAVLIERLKEGAYERPTSVGRGRITARVIGSQRTTESKPPTDAKAFAEWLK